MKALIIYHSTSGVTRALAQKLQAELDCEALEIEPEKAYGSYIPAVMRVGLEKLRRRPTLSSAEAPDLSDYGLILVGCPVWYSAPPDFFSDFLSRCDFSGKAVAPFVTCGGGQVDTSLEKLRELCRGADCLSPYAEGLLRKYDYESWLCELKAYCSES